MATSDTESDLATRAAAGAQPRRADARQNLERVLAAAVEVFTERGLEATIPEIAARAGVGKGTVYRSFPTKADLVRALARPHLDWFHELGAVAVRAASADAYGALEDLLEQIAARLAQDRLMVDVLSGFDDIGDERLAAHLESILALGRSQGTLRPDATGLDLDILVSGVARALIGHDIRDPDVWRRYARLALGALRPDPEPRSP
ncbi:TetR/AcrR family transcriptional regulator [Nocardia bovistercoris]|uniref:TetR/AcrR family transcriptional regulator n=1 Tax=Nocardia bovistercoris TaxID=2785916 RepID=A0A931I8R7_9NOCA|nr:TetR/AcrR family transcriptional regulator [Nocardia bovistercoris]MBH0776754.1 TetR/AcrR family transcriptional regulator [Nocardia bovistercoris]